MRVLCDENIPHKLRGLLPGHEVATVAYLGWAGLKNGVLLNAAEAAGFDVLITSDQSIPFEQNMAGRKLAILMISTPDWNALGVAAGQIAAALDRATPGSLAKVICGKRARNKMGGPQG